MPPACTAASTRPPTPRCAFAEPPVRADGDVVRLVFCVRSTHHKRRTPMIGKKGTRQSGQLIGDATDPQGMTALARTYLEWGRVHNYSELTIDHQLRYLNAFIKWSADRGIARPSDVTKPILERYQRWLFQYRKTN